MGGVATQLDVKQTNQQTNEQTSNNNNNNNKKKKSSGCIRHHNEFRPDWMLNRKVLGIRVGAGSYREWVGGACL